MEGVYHLLKELVIDGTVTAELSMLNTNYQGAIKLANTYKLHRWSKHIAMHYHCTRDQVDKRIIELNYVPTTDMAADGLT